MNLLRRIRSGVVADTDLVLGYDFGTSSVKAGIFAADGAVQAAALCSSPVHFPQSRWVEQPPEDWWRAMSLATRLRLVQCPASIEPIAAIRMSAQMCGARASAMVPAVAERWYGDLRSAALMTHGGNTIYPDRAASVFQLERF